MATLALYASAARLRLRLKLRLRLRLRLTLLVLDGIILPQIEQVEYLCELPIIINLTRHLCGHH